MANSDELTIADVAKAAGVSVSTVSRILNGKQDVAASTRQRVQQVIDELGYIPHAQAQRLRAGKTHTLALVYPFHSNGKRLVNELDLDFVIGAADTAGQNDYFFHFITTTPTSQDLLNLYRSGQVDGVVLMEIYQRDWRVRLLQERGLPFTMIGRSADNTGLSYIDFDFENSIVLSFDAMVELGHCQIGLITYEAALIEQGYGPAVHTLLGYEYALQKHSIERIYREAAIDVQAVYDAACDLLDNVPDMTAIVTTHDVSTVGLLRAAAERGRTVPDDLSIIALIPERLSDLTTPPLTGIDFPSYMMGQNAIQMLINLLNDPNGEPQQILIPPRLYERMSAGPAKKL